VQPDSRRLHLGLRGAADREHVEVVARDQRETERVKPLADLATIVRVAGVAEVDDARRVNVSGAEAALSGAAPKCGARRQTLTNPLTNLAT